MYNTHPGRRSQEGDSLWVQISLSDAILPFVAPLVQGYLNTACLTHTALCRPLNLSPSLSLSISIHIYIYICIYIYIYV